MYAWRLALESIASHPSLSLHKPNEHQSTPARSALEDPRSKEKEVIYLPGAVRSIVQDLLQTWVVLQTDPQASGIEKQGNQATSLQQVYNGDPTSFRIRD